CPPGFVTTTLTDPLACAGATAVIVVLPATFTLVAKLFANFTVAPTAKPVPEMVTVVPPAAGPEFGEILLMTGAVFGVVVKNSDMFAAVAAAPGCVVTPNASSTVRSRFWCWYNVFDWKPCFA